MIEAIRDHGRFEPPTLFTHTAELVQGTISMGVKMGEGWLLTAEMLELADKGVGNIVCTQPFGCLPNHICGKGMMKPIKERNPNVNREDRWERTRKFQLNIYAFPAVGKGQPPFSFSLWKNFF